MNTPRFLLPPAFLISAALASAQTVTVFNETFPENSRTTLSAPDSAAWFSSGDGSNVNYTTGASITQITGSNGRHLLGYFTEDGSPLSLSLGETMTVTFAIQFDRTVALSDASNNFRVGVFDSTAGNRISADNQGGTSAGTLFDNYTGYIATLNLGGGGSNGLRLFERTSTTNQALIGSITGVYTQLGSSTGNDQALQASTVYTGVMTFSRTGAQELTTSFSMTGGTLNAYMTSQTDTTPTFAFDTFAIYATKDSTDSMTLSQLKIETTMAAVPEPATYAALAGVFVAGFAVWRRRKV